MGRGGEDRLGHVMTRQREGVVEKKKSPEVGISVTVAHHYQ